MNLTRLALDNNRTALVILAVLLLAGYMAFTTMPRAYDPGFTIRAAQVITYLPGASARRIEALVTDRIEEVIHELPEVDFVKSESRAGVSIIIVNIQESYSDMRPIWDSLRRKVESVAPDLPEDVSGPYVNDEFGDVFGIVLTITGEGFSYAELEEIASDARREYLRIDDAAKVDIFGVQEERIFIEYDNARLTELNLSPYQLAQMLDSRNIVTPGGAISLGPERILLEASGNFESVDDIADTVIRVPDSNTLVFLKDIATVTRGYIDPARYKVSSSGVPGLALAISMREGGNNIALGEQVNAVTRQLQAAYPFGVDFNIVNFSPEEVSVKVKSFVSSLLQAITVLTLVMLFSLGLRTGLIVAALIPFSILIALLVMNTLSIGLDQISLAALIIALGMLVDNGIVMSENIMVQMAEGRGRVEAAIASAGELKIPLLTSSLTTAAAFLPIYLAESSTGEFTESLFKVVTITLLCSWLLSITIIPLLCVSFLRVKRVARDFSGGFYGLYRHILSACLRFRYVTLIIVVAVFSVSLRGMTYIPSIFFPPSDRGYFKIELELPQGRSLDNMESVVAGVEDFMNAGLRVAPGAGGEGVTSWVSYIGNGGARFVLTHTPKPDSPGYAILVVNTTSAAVIDDMMASLEGFIRDSFPDVSARMKKIETGAPIDNPVEIRVSGDDLDRLFAIVGDLKTQMASNPRLKNISDDWGMRAKKLRVDVNQARALRAGVSSEDIAMSLQTGLSGLELTRYREGSNIIPVTLRSAAATANDMTRLEGLSVYAQSSGGAVPLKQVADIDLVWEPGKVLRRDRTRTVTVGAQLVGDYTAAEGFAALQPWLDEHSATWGMGYRYALGGEAESSAKANQSIMDKLPIAALIIVILLVGQFNSTRKAVIVLMTIPLGLIGVIPGLLVFQSYFGFMTLLGIISLAGIVINNAIVLLERIQIEIDAGRIPFDAVIEAAQRRARPILLTTATTVLGLIPLYLGGGEMWEPMAVAIMAGLLFATFLTLIVVPVLYATLFRVKTA